MDNQPRGLYPPFLPWNVTHSLADDPQFKPRYVPERLRASYKRRKAEYATRNAAIIEMAANGIRVEYIANQFNITDERVVEIIKGRK